MDFTAYFQTVGAVVLGNILSFVLAYGVWRAGRAEKNLGIENGAYALPFWLLIGMMIGPGISAWAAYSIR